MSPHDKLDLAESMHYCRGNLIRGCDHKSEDCICEPIEVTDLQQKLQLQLVNGHWIFMTKTENL